MRANIFFIRDKFAEFNALCFDGKLPPIELRIGTARRTLGTFTYPVRYDSRRRRGVGECKITISRRFDLPQSEIEDTLIHEMIHYWKWMEHLEAEPAHGPAFRKKMNEINSRFGRQIAIRHISEEEQLQTDIHLKNHYICITHWSDGSLAITLSARTRIFEINGIWTADSRVKNVEWYWSKDPWFNRFPIARSGKAWRLSKDDYIHHVIPQLRFEIKNGKFYPSKQS